MQIFKNHEMDKNTLELTLNMNSSDDADFI